MNGQQPITVTLQFQKPLIPLIMENKIHPSMEVVTSSADKLLVTLTVFDTIELKNLILSYGSNVEVIEPLSLRADIKVELQKTLLAYE
jgi:predicted DNA-binding transcriptional regulator YafY